MDLTKIITLTSASLFIFSACASYAQDSYSRNDELAVGMDAGVRSAIVNNDGAHVGEAIIKQGPHGVLVRVGLDGLSEGWHGLHLHQVGDCSDGALGFKASEGHINPEGNAHGLLHDDGYEFADMPNIYAGADGEAVAAFFKPFVPASGGVSKVLFDADGFAIIIHQNADDHLTQPIGGAGSRVACAAFYGSAQ